MKESTEYPRTARLLKTAKKEGQYRNKDIAIKAGLSEKSGGQVTKWLKGQSKATYRQLKYFINKYEHLINRADKHLFRSLKKDEDGSTKIIYLQLDGELVLNHSSYQYYQNGRNIKRIVIKRIRIIKNGERFWLVLQDRAIVNEQALNNQYNYVSGENENAIWWSKCHEITKDELLEWADNGLAQFYGRL